MGNVIKKQEHDVYGALIREITFTWNDDNRLTEVKDGADQTIATYTYNGLGQRIKKQVGSSTTIFLYDLQGNIISEMRDNSYDDYLYVASQRIARITISDSIYYYHNDHLGTPLVMTNSSAAVVWKARYKTFSEAQVDASSTVTNNFRFPGQYYDQETGLHYNYHRYYDPTTGRYLSADPIGLKGGINLFGYVYNNPIRLTDIMGLRVFCVGVGAYGGLLIPHIAPITGGGGGSVKYCWDDNDNAGFVFCWAGMGGIGAGGIIGVEGTKSLVDTLCDFTNSPGYGWTGGYASGLGVSVTTNFDNQIDIVVGGGGGKWAGGRTIGGCVLLKQTKGTPNCKKDCNNNK